MKYERLTDRKIAEMLRNTVEKSWDSDSLEAQCYIRLAELENKIEDGELISTVQSEQGEQEVAYFAKHNAAVRKQAVIKFAVMLKKKADSYNYEESYINRSVMYTDIDDLVTEVCGK